MLATVFFAAGTPMLLAGDEFGRTQRGNNNAYCQDNEISWLDWQAAARPDNAAFAAYRRAADCLAPGARGFALPELSAWRREPAPGVNDIAWFDEQGGGISPAAWNDPEQRTLMLRRAAANARRDGDDLHAAA